MLKMDEVGNFVIENTEYRVYKCENSCGRWITYAHHGPIGWGNYNYAGDDQDNFEEIWNLDNDELTFRIIKKIMDINASLKEAIGW